MRARTPPLVLASAGLVITATLVAAMGYWAVDAINGSPNLALAGISAFVAGVVAARVITRLPVQQKRHSGYGAAAVVVGALVARSSSAIQVAFTCVASGYLLYTLLRMLAHLPRALRR